MAFTGDLENIPIVDIIQLLHSSRKSGILRVSSRKGESHLVFKDGYIVSANHLNNSVRIGKILTDLQILTPQLLEQALREQSGAGSERRPLIVSLVEKGLVQEEQAYRALEQLIEMTLVEILTWKRGSFCLEPSRAPVTDDYRYYPDRMSREINVDTQSVLMEALRIFDERVRDGELTEDPGDDPDSISADDLGLGILEELQTEVPEVFSALEDKRRESSSCLDQLEQAAPELSPQVRQELAEGLAQSSLPRVPRPALVATADPLLGCCCSTVNTATTLCLPEEEAVCAEAGRRVALGEAPVIAVDGTSASLRRRLQQEFPQLPLVEIHPARECSAMLAALREGVKALPKPDRVGPAFAADMVQLVEALHRAFADGGASTATGEDLARLVLETVDLPAPPAIALALLRFAAAVAGRGVTLILRDGEAVAEKAILDGRVNVCAAPPLRLPLGEGTLLRRVAEDGTPYCGPADDTLRTHLYPLLGAPRDERSIILPLRSGARTVSLAYADAGEGRLPEVPAELLRGAALHASLVLEKALLRRRKEPAGQ